MYTLIIQVLLGRRKDKDAVPEWFANHDVVTQLEVKLDIVELIVHDVSSVHRVALLKGLQDTVPVLFRV